MGCRVKPNRHGYLAFRLIWSGIRSWEGTKHKDTPENRKLLEARASVISQEMQERRFDYLRWFPTGSKAYLFHRKEETARAPHTIDSYYRVWIKKQPSRVRPHRIKDYRSHFGRHILPTKVEKSVFGKLPLVRLTYEDLKSLQRKLTEKGLKASSVNGIVHGSLRALLRDARSEGLISLDLFDRPSLNPFR